MSEETTTQATHTPGPWVILRSPIAEQDYGGGASIASADEQTLIAVLCWDMDTSRWTAENEANARLIAAAPDMYEALRSAYAIVRLDARHDADLIPVLHQIEDAMARAEGRS